MGVFSTWQTAYHATVQNMDNAVSERHFSRRSKEDFNTRAERARIFLVRAI